ncbi:MAG: DinB family protein [Gemmatimonadaceae bacterium]|nr:DinB family protein [Gemmatimonadaceae bacterium]
MLPAARVSAQTAPVVTDLMKDIDGVAQKLVALAKAMPVDKYGWRPGAGVRSVGEVFLHVASDNYLMPALAGTAMPRPPSWT